MVSNSDIFRCFQHIEDNIDACNLSEATRTFVLDNSEILNYIEEKESFRKLIDKKQFEKAGKRLTEFHETSMPTERRKKTRQSRTTGVATGLLNRIQQAWSRDFTGDTTTRFQDFLEKSESNFNSNKHYTKVIAVVQSSGAGKSRLMDELSKRSVGIVFTLRFGDQSGYPPGDIEVTKLLLNSVSRIVTAIESIEHTTCVALLSAAIEESMGSSLCSKLQRTDQLVVSATFKEFKGKRFEFPLYFHDKMAAPPLAKPAETDPKNPVISAQGFSSIRSEFRKKFCERIVRKASVLVKAFEDDDDWKKIFQETPVSSVSLTSKTRH